MVLLLAGSTHTGKTFWAQRLMEQYRFPYLSIDHLKMGLIRAGLCPLTPESPDEELTAFLWPIVREMVKTCIENGQNLMVEGCYIPFDFAASFPPEYRKEIRYLCLIFSEGYLNRHFDEILAHENAVEQRINPCSCTSQQLLSENRSNLERCIAYGCPYQLIDEEYPSQLVFSPPL